VGANPCSPIDINPRIAQECRTTVSGAISLSPSSIARGCPEPAAVEIDDVAAPARCLDLLFGDIISCSLLEAAALCRGSSLGAVTRLRSGLKHNGS
jgi:hypothetical protein